MGAVHHVLGMIELVEILVAQKLGVVPMLSLSKTLILLLSQRVWCFINAHQIFEVLMNYGVNSVDWPLKHLCGPDLFGLRRVFVELRILIHLKEILEKSFVYALGRLANIQSLELSGDNSIGVDRSRFEVVLFDLRGVKIEHAYEGLLEFFYMTIEFRIRARDILTDDLAAALSIWTSSFIEVIVI